MKYKYPFLKTINRIIYKALTTDKKIILYLVIFTIAASLLPLFPVFLPRFIISELVKDVVDFEYIVKVVLIATLMMAVLSFTEKFATDTCRPRITMIRIDYLTEGFKKISELDYKYNEDPKFQDEIRNPLNAISGSSTGFEEIMSRLFNFLSKVITIIIYIAIVSRLSVYVILGLVASVAISITVSIIVKKFRYKNRENFAHAERVIEYYTNTTHDFRYGKDIRLYDLQDKILDSYDYEIKSYMTVFRKVKNKEYFLAFLDLLFVLISDAILYYILITKVLNGMPIADFSMYLVATISLSTILKTTSEDFSFIIGEGLYCHDYFKFIEKDYNEASSGLSKIENDTLEIEFKNVSFKYPNTEKWIIRNLNLKISKKEKLAIVGINGAGKTTLVKLILRFFSPTEGEILINGINIKDFALEEYYKMFAVVFQEINILAYPIRENITLGLSNDEERIWDCLYRVGLKNKVTNLEKGLEQMMLKVIDEKGTIFSGGENQKLAIARALYKDGNAVILDEPTASLDALAEAEIYQNFNDLVADKTAIYISHRLASTKFCDHIALFKDTGLLEYGTHDELMALKGEYYHMFTVQGKYYQEENNHAQPQEN